MVPTNKIGIKLRDRKVYKEKIGFKFVFGNVSYRDLSIFVGHVLQKL
jgi:hypothetical protein